jgi:hypothetical protein
MLSVVVLRNADDSGENTVGIINRLARYESWTCVIELDDLEGGTYDENLSDWASVAAREVLILAEIASTANRDYVGEVLSYQARLTNLLASLFRSRI